jgi:O6-methylguanine-DNA--protein-cysteine methyltransferase
MSKPTTTFESEVKNCWAYGKFAVELLERVAADNKLNVDTVWSQYFPTLTRVKAMKNARHFVKQCDPRNTVAPAKSDYHFYLTAQSEAIKNKGEVYKIAKHGKVIGGLWKALSDTERAVYQQLAATDKERRQKELDVIEESIRSGSLQDSPFRRSVRHRTGNVSALNMYVKEMTRTLRESEPTMSNTQRMKQIHQQWSGLSEGDRAKYQKIADETNRAHAEASTAAATSAPVPATPAPVVVAAASVKFIPALVLAAVGAALPIK